MEVSLPKELGPQTVEADHQQIFLAYNIWAWVEYYACSSVCDGWFYFVYQASSGNYQHYSFQLWEAGFPWSEEQVWYRVAQNTNSNGMEIALSFKIRLSDRVGINKRFMMQRYKQRFFVDFAGSGRWWRRTRSSPKVCSTICWWLPVLDNLKLWNIKHWLKSYTMININWR